MTESPILVRRDDAGFAVVTLNRPEALNALSGALRRELASAVAGLEADPAIHVLILTAAGRIFTAGLDLREWGEAGAPAAGAFDDDPVRVLAGFSGPVIGAINGPAITGGFEIAVACDVLIASERASFADTHARVGLLPGWGLSPRLSRLVGEQRAKLLAFTAQTLSAQQALAWGLVSEVVPPERLLPAAEALARQMLAGDPATLAAYKRLLDDGAAQTLDAALAHERASALAWNAQVDRDTLLARLERLRASRPRSA
jgi:enoyl-CoA hydratase